MLALDPRTTALVLVDLQNGVRAIPLQPYPADQVIGVATSLAQRFRAAGAPVVLVRVGFSDDLGDALRQPVDERRPAGARPPGFDQLVEGLAQPGDLHVLKRQWGAFFGTDLDLQLRRRGLRTVVLGGVATNFGVESTARQAWEHGYEVVIVEDATSTASAEHQAFAFRHVFPRIARVTRSDELQLG